MSAAAEINLSDFNEDILDMILHHLDLVGFIHFGAVCRSWRSLTVNHRSRCCSCPKNQIPWLLLANQWLSNERISVLCFYCIASQKSYNIRVDPSLWLAQIIGSSNGFLLANDHAYNLHVFNPLTGAQYPLPPFSDRFISLVELVYHFLDTSFIKISSSSSQPSLVVIASNGRLQFANVGDSSWTEFEFGIPSCLYIDNIVVHKNKLYTIHETGIYIFDLDLPLNEPTKLVSQFQYKLQEECTYFVESPNGADLFLLLDNVEIKDGELSKSNFVGHKFDETHGQFNEIKDVGDYAIFVEGSNSFFFPASQFVTRNTISVTDTWSHDGVTVFDLGDGSSRQSDLVDLPQNDWGIRYWFTPFMV